MENIYKCFCEKEIPDGNLRCRWDNNNWFVKHTHDFWEFQIVYSGNYSQTINGKRYESTVNQGILVPPTSIHQVLPSKSDNAYHLNIVISCNSLEEACSAFSSDFYCKLSECEPKVVTLSNSKINDINKYVSAITYAETNDTVKPKKKELNKSLLMYILNLIYISYFMEENTYPEIIREFIQTISLPKNFSLPVSELAKATGFSYSHLSKIFKRNTNQTINQFFLKKKLEYASDSLNKDTNVNITELSLFLGFESISHFIYIFKKEYGVSPLKYKKQQSTFTT